VENWDILSECSFDEKDIPNNIAKDTEDRLEALREGLVLHDELIEDFRQTFDTVFGLKADFESVGNIYDTLYTVVFRILLKHNFQREDINSAKKIDNLLVLNGVAPLKIFTTIRKNENWRYVLWWAIASKKCSLKVNTKEFTPQDIISFDTNSEVNSYGEILYKFPQPFSRRAAFNSGTDEVFLFTWLIKKLNKESSDKVIQAKIESSLANELGHLQFETVISEEFWLTRESVFFYKWKEYSYFQMSELWSDYSSHLKDYENSKKIWTWKIVNDQIRNTVRWTIGNSSYDLTRRFFADIIVWDPDRDSFFQELDEWILSILKSAKQ